MSVTATLSVKLTSMDIATASITGGAGSSQQPGLFEILQEMAAGSGQNQVEVSCLTTRALVSTNENLDLTALPDLRTGTNKAFAKVKLLAIKGNGMTAGNTLTMQPGASNGFAALFADDILLNGGGWAIFYSPDGETVDATHKVINVALDHSSSYTLFVLGN